MTDEPSGDLLLSGEIDFSVVDEVYAQAETVLETRPDVLVIDLAAVTFMDSQAVALLVRIKTHAARTDTKVRLRGVPSRVHQLLEITGLQNYFEVE